MYSYIDCFYKNIQNVIPKKTQIHCMSITFMLRVMELVKTSIRMIHIETLKHVNAMTIETKYKLKRWSTMSLNC